MSTNEETEARRNAAIKKWDLDKIQRAALILMGWKEVVYADEVCEDGSVWEGYTVLTKDGYEWDCWEDDYANPIYSLDDATPLMEKYSMSLRYCPSFDPQWYALGFIPDNKEPPWYSRAPSFGIQAEWAALAVCLCALRNAGHNLKDYEKKETDNVDQNV